MLTPAQRAAAIIRHYVDSADPDRRTSMADARIALCLARGVAMDDIDPASGYDRSRDAYDECRASWVDLIKQDGFSEFYDRERIQKVFASWSARRPDFTDGDDWVAAGVAAHCALWAENSRICWRPICDIHPSEDHAELLRVIAEMEAADAAEHAAPDPGVQESMFD